MKKMKNEIYTLVDEEYISNFHGKQMEFMKEFYYSEYCSYCNYIERKPLNIDDFFTNMHRRRIQIYQLCCPFCESIFHFIHDKKVQKEAGYNYCPHCGRTSAILNVQNHLYRFIRIHNINKLGLEQMAIKKTDAEKWLLGYDCYQMELIELASIIEVVFREYFEALIFIGNLGLSSKYIKKVISKETKNDFMNIEKANENYKKAFDLNIREKLDSKIWNNLIDVVNLRNMMVHNNGNIDDRFKNTPSYARCKDHVVGNLYKLEDKDIAEYLGSVICAIVKITEIYCTKYSHLRNNVVSNYYFNKIEE